MTVRIPVRPALLRWALQRCGRPIADFPKLPGWLDGSRVPTLRQLEAFAAATTVTVGQLLFDEPPVETLPIADLRTLGDRPPRAPSAELLDTLYACQQRQAWYREYAQTVGQPPVGVVRSVSEATHPAEAAAVLHQSLRFAVDDRGATADDALRVLSGRAEAVGVLVMRNGIVGNNTHRPLDPDEFRGFALVDPLAPLVFVNTADAATARLFTLAHELAHVWSGTSALSDAIPSSQPTAHSERWCNAVAAELLVPMADLRGRLDPSAEPLPEATRLARVYRVSSLVLLRRMHDAGALSADDLAVLTAQEIARFRGRRRREGGGDYHRTQRARLGTRFVSAVLESTWEGRTSFTEAFRLVGESSVEGLRAIGQVVGQEAA